MAPFPFGPALTYSALFQVLTDEHGCTASILSIAGEMHDADGTPTPAVYLFKRTNAAGQQMHAVITVYEESDYVMPTTLRSVCRALDLLDEFLSYL